MDGSLAQLGGRKTQAHAVSLPPSPAQVGRIHGGPDWASESAWGKAVSLELGKRVQPGPAESSLGQPNHMHIPRIK